MNADLEKTLEELGPEYRDVVSRLKSAYEPRETVFAPAAVGRQNHAGRVVGWTAAYLAAASLLVFAGLGAIFAFSRPQSEPVRVYTVRASDMRTEYVLAHVRSDEAVKEMIRTQRADGGWSTDFLTRQNAEALKGRKDEASRIAYKKAVRNLRAHGYDM